MNQPSILDEAPGIVVLFPPTAQANDYFMRYLRLFSEIERTIVTVASDGQATAQFQTWSASNAELTIDPSALHALWLVDDTLEFQAERTTAFRNWFANRFKFCARYHLDERMTVNAYMRVEYPCAAWLGGAMS